MFTPAVASSRARRSLHASLCRSRLFTVTLEDAPLTDLHTVNRLLELCFFLMYAHLPDTGRVPPADVLAKGACVAMRDYIRDVTELA